MHTFAKFSLLSALALTLPAVTTRVAHADDLKLGYVDIQRAINETAEGQAAKKKLKGMFDARQKELDEKQQDLKKMKEELDKQRTLLKQDVIAAREKDLQDKFVQLQGTYVRLQKELSEREGEMMKGIVGKMQGVIGQIAQQENFTVVLEKTESSILWAKPSLDLTNEVIRRYNSSAGSAPAAPAKSSKK
jgi:outer membrane protein